MARLLFFIVKFLPFWALPLSMIAFEVAFVYKRRGEKGVMYRAIGVGVFFILLTACFFIFRWDKVGMQFLRDLFFQEEG